MAPRNLPGEKILTPRSAADFDAQVIRVDQPRDALEPSISMEASYQNFLMICSWCSEKINKLNYSLGKGGEESERKNPSLSIQVVRRNREAWYWHIPGDNCHTFCQHNFSHQNPLVFMIVTIGWPFVPFSSAFGYPVISYQTPLSWATTMQFFGSLWVKDNKQFWLHLIFLVSWRGWKTVNIFHFTDHRQELWMGNFVSLLWPHLIKFHLLPF